MFFFSGHGTSLDRWEVWKAWDTQMGQNLGLTHGKIRFNLDSRHSCPIIFSASFMISCPTIYTDFFDFTWFQRVSNRIKEYYQSLIRTCMQGTILLFCQKMSGFDKV